MMLLPWSASVYLYICQKHFGRWQGAHLSHYSQWKTSWFLRFDWRNWRESFTSMLLGGMGWSQGGLLHLRIHSGTFNFRVIINFLCSNKSDVIWLKRCQHHYGDRPDFLSACSKNSGNCWMSVGHSIRRKNQFHETMFFFQVNHHFHLNNSVYSEMEHPRFGPIMSVRTKVPIKAGENADLLCWRRESIS